MAPRTISPEAVKAKTGKDWDEWLAILDKENATSMDHKQVAQMLASKYDISPWWSQMVTVGYERARGKREINQTKQGFVANLSRTMYVSRVTLWEALQEDAIRQWLQTGFSITSTSEPKSLRIRLDDGSRVELWMLDKGKKSAITAQHMDLKSAEDVAEKKEFWSQAFERLKKQVEPA